MNERDFRTLVERETGASVADMRWVSGVDAFVLRLSDDRVATVTSLGTAGRTMIDIIREAFPKVAA